MDNQITIEGKILEVGSIEIIESIKGPRKKQQILMAYRNGKYINEIAPSLWGRNVNKLRVGDNVKLYISIEVLKYEERYINNLSAWRTEFLNNNQK